MRSAGKLIVGAVCAGACLGAGLTPSLAAPAPAPRITSIYGGLQVTGTTLFASFDYCDDAARPATFRHLIRAFDRNGKLIGSRTTTRLNPRSRCTSLTAISVSTGSSVARAFSVKVTNLRSGRSATRRTSSIF